MIPRRALVAVLTFGSGVSALVYQLAWERSLRLIFGASTAATSAVLAIFTAGLGAGSALLGRRADSDARPLVLYGRLEVGIAAFAAVTPFLFGPVQAVYALLGGSARLGSAGGTIVRLLLAAVVLAVPTVLMGGTLPAAVRSALPVADRGRRYVGVLYATNTLGAVVGALASTFVSFERFGTRRSIWLAAAMNLVVGLVAMGIGRRRSVDTQAHQDEAPAEGPLDPRRRVRFVSGAAFVTGFVFFAMELVYYRMLAPLLGGSVFTFGLILAVALLGIALGGALYAAFSRQATLRALATTCLLEALFLGLPIVAGDRIALIALALRPVGAGTLATLAPGWALVTSIVVLPVAIVAGFQYPLLIGLLGAGRRDIGAHAGRAAFLNTAGSVTGALLAGFVLVPRVGAIGTWRAMAGLAALLGVGAFTLERGRISRRLVYLGAACSIALGASLAEGPTAAWRHGSIGVGRVDRAVLQSPNAFRAFRNDARRAIVWETDGVESSVALDAQDGLAFVVNGKVDGNARNDAATQVMGGILGAILHGDPKAAAVVGLGTGSSAGWLASVPSIGRVDVAELEPAMLEVARRSASVNREVLSNPKVHVVLGDARETVLGLEGGYDVIFSEPSNPYRAGIASLFSRQYYEAVQARLGARGLFLQWVQLYEIDRATIETIYRTLGSVFPFVESWRLGSFDLVLVASREEPRYDARALRARLDEEPYRTALRVAWSTEGLEGLLAHYVGRSSLARRFAEPGVVSTDDRNVVEYGFVRNVGNFAELGAILDAAREHGEQLPAIEHDDVDRVRVEDERLLAFAAEGIEPTVPQGLAPEAEVRATALVNYVAGNVGGAIERWTFQSRPARGRVETALVAEGLAEQGSPEARAAIERLRGYDGIEADSVLARALLREGKIAEATELLAGAFERMRADPWPSTTLMRRALDLADEIASTDLESSLRFLRALEKPFAARVLDAARKRAVLSIAQRIVTENRCGPAWSELEPHVPWDVASLGARAACYRFYMDVRRDQAARDLETFQSCENAGFIRCF